MKFTKTKKYKESIVIVQMKKVEIQVIKLKKFKFNNPLLDNIFMN